MNIFGNTYKLFTCSLRTMLWSSFLLFASPAMAGGQVVNVTGTGNGDCVGNPNTCDRVVLQNAVNAATPFTTLLLHGTFQLDGTSVNISKSNLKIIGSGVDNNNSWGTEIIGLVNPDGTPQKNQSAPSFNLNNNGFLLLHGSSNITIQGIKFANLNVPLFIVPQAVSPLTSNLCSKINIVPSGGTNYVITQNWIDNSNRPISGFGNASKVEISKNKVTNSGYTAFDIVLSGTNAAGCAVPNGQGGFSTQAIVGLINPSQIIISNNQIQSDSAVDQIALLVVENVLVSANNISAGANTECSIIGRTNNGIITLNNVDLGGVGLCGIAVDAAIEAPFNNPINLVSYNTVSNSDPSVGIGVGLDDGITGVLAFSNIFKNIGATEYLLCDANADTNDEAAALCDGLGTTTSNNVVITSKQYRVMDLGVKNKIVTIK